jgi:hypothetical protein
MKGSSEREWLALHAEVKAMQEQYGLSYKDSAHHLYLAEVGQLKALDRAHKLFAAIQQRIDKVVDHELLPPSPDATTSYQCRWISWSIIMYF